MTTAHTQRKLVNSAEHPGSEPRFALTRGILCGRRSPAAAVEIEPAAANHCAMSHSGRVHGSSAARGGRIIVNARDVIEDVDSSVCTLLGYAKEEIIGMHGSELVPLDAHAATAVSLDRMRHGEVTDRPGRLRHRNGAVLDVHVTARMLSDGRLLLALRTHALG